MISGIVVTVVGAAVVAAWAVVINRRAMRAKAGLDAVQTYSQMVSDLRGEIERLQGDLTQLRTEFDQAITANEGLRSRIATLQRTVDRMTRLLSEHNIPVPQEAT